ncbi:hypothetical protein [Polyangium fumosum]|uniref:hypothetical protein n=1 Tax=Polyangium fumosum TaxID=889272 RepID=UPI0010AE573B|nr:hypothetical protein [Polyangium fumosum]
MSVLANTSACCQESKAPPLPFQGPRIDMRLRFVFGTNSLPSPSMNPSELSILRSAWAMSKS